MEQTRYINMNDYEALRAFEGSRKIRNTITQRNLEEVNRISLPAKPRNTFYSKYGKRMLDIVLSAVALILTSPVNLILAVITRFDVGRPILFRQERIGRDGKLFQIVKFRNMTNEVDSNGNLLPAKDRVTKFGRFVRKTSLDELLNFWSILKGDMSLIGPRPLVPAYGLSMSERHKQRHAVRPGLECPYLKTPDHAPTWTEQFEHDVWYVENVSFLTDLKLALALVRTVFDRKSTAVRSAANRGTFMGYHPDGTAINSHQVPAEYITFPYEETEAKEVVI